MKKRSQIRCKFYSYDRYHNINYQIAFDETLNQNQSNQ